MTFAQRERRIRQIAAKVARLNDEIHQLELEAGPIEREHSRSLGFSFPPLRGRALLDVMDREQVQAA